MAEGVTKNPQFTTDAEIRQENDRRKQSIEQILKVPPEQIRSAIRCTLDAAVGRAFTPPPGEMLYVLKRWLIRPEDRKKHDSLMFSQAAMMSGGADVPSPSTIDRVLEIQRELDEIYRRGSDHLRASVVRAADWACVPAELLAAVLQNENSPKASDFKRGGQALERDIQALIGRGSTGFGNVKPETLRHVTELFRHYYKSSVLRAGVKNVGQNDNAETDIYHAAAALRDGLNKAWSAGPRSLNAELSKRYTYYPYFGGTVTKDVAVRAMGHYNGMGDSAKTYGEAGLNRVQKQTLHFLPPTRGVGAAP
jgi:hypothetical protein